MYPRKPIVRFLSKTLSNSSRNFHCHGSILSYFNEFEFANNKSKSYLYKMGCLGRNNITTGLLNSSHKFMKEEDDIKCQKNMHLLFNQSLLNLLHACVIPLPHFSNMAGVTSLANC